MSDLKNEYYKQFVEELNLTKLKYDSSTTEHKLLKQNFDHIQGDLEKVKQLKNQAEAELDKYELESEIVIFFYYHKCSFDLVKICRN